MCFILWVCLGRISWQSNEWSLQQKLTSVMSDRLKCELAGEEMDEEQRQTRCLMVCGGRSGPHREQRNSSSKLHKPLPRACPNKDHSEMVQEAGKAVREGLGVWVLIFEWVAPSEDENRLFLPGRRAMKRSASPCCWGVGRKDLVFSVMRLVIVPTRPGTERQWKEWIKTLGEHGAQIGVLEDHQVKHTCSMVGFL